MKNKSGKQSVKQSVETVEVVEDKQVAVTQSNPLANSDFSYDMGDFMDDGLEMTDVKLEKLVITQSNSKIREENETLIEGDSYLSVSRIKAVSKGKRILFIPLYIKKLVVIYQNESKNADPKLAKKGPWIQTVNAREVPKDLAYIDENEIRQQTKSVFACILDEGFQRIFPTRCDFKSSSMKAINPLILKVTEHVNKELGNLPIDLVFSLGTKKVTNEKSSWFIWDVAFERLASEKEKLDSAKCVELLKSLKEEVIYNEADSVDE